MFFSRMGVQRSTFNVQRQALVCKNRPRVVFEIPVSPWLKDKFMEYYTRARYGSSFFPSWLRKTGSKYVSSRLLVEQIYMEKKDIGSYYCIDQINDVV